MSKIGGAIAFAMSLIPCASNAGAVDLATFSCASYQDQILNAAPADQSEDALNFSMWLFGYAVARSGDHAIYGNGLQAFGNALDEECKSRPAASLLDAVAAIKPNGTNPMDLRELDCATFESRHADLVRSDHESARTIMMWLFGFAAGKAGGQVIDSSLVDDFAKALAAQCAKRSTGSVFDALVAVKTTKPKKAKAAPVAPQSAR